MAAPPTDPAAFVQQLLDNLNQAGANMLAQAEAAAQRLAEALPPAADPDEALVRQVLADPELRKQVLALARPARPGSAPPAPG